VVYPQFDRWEVRKPVNDVRDPLFRLIRQRLAEPIDPDLFEKFAIELIRPDFPTAVLVAGGSDGGVDGWVHSPDQPPIPVVTTTAEDVLRNLRRNLSTCKEQWPEYANTAIVVTSMSLTATRQMNLTKAARNMGFRLVLFEEASVAAALYRMPKWRIQLLGIPGDPPALSQVPPGRSLPLEIEPVGRESDLQWLIKTSGDRLLTGQPGAGKTFLLSRYAKACDAFFVTSDDAGKIADAVRELQPKALIIDDAHAYPTLLETVRRTRQQIEADFDIVACTWSSFEGPAIQELGAITSNVRELSLLTREEIAEVIRRLGVEGPDRLVAHILDQASGRVGLAASLTMRLLAGDWDDVVSGDSLIRYATTSLQQHVNIQLLPVFATFGLGGASGVDREEVANFLKHSLLDLAAVTATIGSTGFLAVAQDWSGKHTVRVEPQVLREAAVRKAFFDTSVPLPIEPFLATVGDTCEAASTLVGARMQGALVPPSLIESLLERCSSRHPWVRFAALGNREACWVLGKRPRLVLEEPWPFLAHVPGPAIEKLLDSAMGDDRPLNSTPGHGLRRIQDWLKAGNPGHDAVDRRKTVNEAALRWGAGDSTRVPVAQQAALLSLDPEFKASNLDLISEEKLTLRWGLLPQGDLEAIFELWSGTVAFLRRSGIADWNHLLEHLRRWIFLGNSQSAPEATYEAVRASIQMMIDDSSSMARGHPAVLRAITEVAAVRQFTFPGIDDELFMTLYPLEERPGDEREFRQHSLAVTRLARLLVKGTPLEAIEKLERCVSERRLVERVHPDFFDFFFWEAARLAKDPFAWLDGIAESDLPPTALRPFLHAAHSYGPDQWCTKVGQLINDERWTTVVAEVVLTYEDVPVALLNQAISVLSPDPDTVEILCRRGQVPIANLKRILSSQHREIAAAAASGEWSCDPGQSVRPELLNEWFKAARMIPPSHYAVGAILQRYPSLARGWLVEQAVAIARDATHPTVEKAAVLALQLIGVPAWPEILPAFGDTYHLHDLVRLAIGQDLRRYRALLRRPDLRDFHLAPLVGPPDDRWLRMVAAALEVGYTADRIVAATLGELPSWMGRESDHWAAWLTSLPAYSGDDPHLRHVVDTLRNKLEELKRAAEETERAEAINGSP